MQISRRLIFYEAQIVMPNQSCQRNAHLKQCQTTFNIEIKKESYGFPMQPHLPGRKGTQAAFVQVSDPRSVSIHLSGMKEYGFEKYRLSWTIVQFEQLTSVYY